MAADQYDPNGGTDTSNGNGGDWWSQNQPPQQPPGTIFRGPGVYQYPDGSYVGQNGKTYDAQGNEVNPDDALRIGRIAHGSTPAPSDPAPQPDQPQGAQTWGGPVAPFDQTANPYPTFTPPPLPDSLKTPWTLPTAESLLSTPGYLSRYQQGLDARQRSAAGRGTILNGGTQKALDRYGSDYAQQGYQQDVDNSLQQRQQASNDYLNLAYGPAWQQNSAAVNQYGTLYKNYQDQIANNRNSQTDFWNQQLDLLNAGLKAAGAGSPGSTGGQG